MEHSDDNISHQVRQNLEQQASELDQQTVDALDTIRQQVLQEAQQKNQKQDSWNYWAYGSAVAASVLLVTLFISTDINDNKPAIEPASLQTGFDIALTNEDFELLEEDIEFYLWLENESAQG